MIDWKECIGLVATVIILISTFQRSTVKLRRYNIVGSILMVIYGVLIGALSVWLLNGLCTIFHIHRLYQRKKAKDVKCIVIGFPGIGKSSVAESDDKFIDLESNSFWIGNTRPDNWTQLYCQVAANLANDGHIVFVSSHHSVRKRLESCRLPKDVKLYICYPDESLQDFWLDKLRRRYELTGLDKDKKALDNCEKHYLENVLDMKASKIPSIVIHNENYDLSTEIFKVVQK